MTDVAGSLVSSSSGSGTGTINTITTATPGTVTITNPTGPSTEIDVTTPGGTISNLTTSTPSTVTITNPTGPTTNLAVAVTPGVADLTTTLPGTVIISNPTGPTTNIDVVTSGAGGVRYNANAPGATPLSAVSLLAYNVIELTGIAATITSMNPSTMPTDPTYQVRMLLMDNGTPQAITWGSDYEVSSELPTTTLGGGVNPIPLYVVFYYNDVTTKLVCVGISAVTPTVYQDLGSTDVAVSTTPAVIFNPTLSVGLWDITATVYYRNETTAGIFGMVYIPATPSGTATYTTPSGTGNPTGAIGATPTATAGDNGLCLTFRLVISVTVAGTVQIMGVVGSGSGTPIFKAQQNFSSTTVQVSSVTCVQIG